MTRTMYQVSREYLMPMDIEIKSSRNTHFNLFSISSTFRNIHGISRRTGDINHLSDNDYDACLDIDMCSTNLPNIWNCAMIHESVERYRKIIGDNNAQ